MILPQVCVTKSQTRIKICHVWRAMKYDEREWEPFASITLWRNALSKGLHSRVWVSTCSFSQGCDAKNTNIISIQEPFQHF